MYGNRKISRGENRLGYSGAAGFFLSRSEPICYPPCVCLLLGMLSAQVGASAVTAPGSSDVGMLPVTGRNEYGVQLNRKVPASVRIAGQFSPADIAIVPPPGKVPALSLPATEPEPGRFRQRNSPASNRLMLYFSIADGGCIRIARRDSNQPSPGLIRPAGGIFRDYRGGPADSLETAGRGCAALVPYGLLCNAAERCHTYQVRQAVRLHLVHYPRTVHLNGAIADLQSPGQIPV